MKEKIYLGKEMEDFLKDRVNILTQIYLVKHRKRIIEGYLRENISILVEKDRLLTSNEVCKLLQISNQTLGRKIKNKEIIPTNPTAKKCYKFKKSDILALIK